MGKEKKWILKDVADGETVARLSSELGIDPVLSKLLVQRGIGSFQEARAFFRPSLDNLHDPFLMKDMDKAVDRVGAAVKSGEKILVYGDYDVDGTTAVSLVYSFLRKLTRNVDFYVPDRYDEGYGVSYKGIDWAADNGFGLIITLDCGIKANDKVFYAADRGIDMIICDHHLPENDLPAAVAVLDPKRADCGYPFDDLSGCGVGFKLVQAYSQKNGIPFDSLIPLLDLLVVSISSDLVSVVGENRILAHFGLKQLNENPRKGLLAMIHLSGLDPEHITIDDIVFKIGPRINAAGRMESGRMAVELLTAENDEVAARIGSEINRYNNERKNIDREITREALEMVQSGNCLSARNATIVYNPSWHKGVVGIVASRLVEAFYRPTIVFTRSNGFVTGSARSVHGFQTTDFDITKAKKGESGPDFPLDSVRDIGEPGFRVPVILVIEVAVLQDFSKLQRHGGSFGNVLGTNHMTGKILAEIQNRFSVGGMDDLLYREGFHVVQRERIPGAQLAGSGNNDCFFPCSQRTGVVLGFAVVDVRQCGKTGSILPGFIGADGVHASVRIFDPKLRNQCQRAFIMGGFSQSKMPTIPAVT